MLKGSFGRNLPVQAALDGVADGIVADLGCDMSVISVAQNNSLVSLGLSASTGRTAALRRPFADHMICSSTMMQNVPLALADAAEHPVFREMPTVADGTVRAYLGMAINNAEIGAIGAVCALSRKPRDWTKPELGYITSVSLAIENMILKEMYRIESADVRREISEYDSIISAFAAVRADPTSIHQRSGRMVFANAALTECLSVVELHGRGLRALLHDAGEGELQYSSVDGGEFMVQLKCTDSGYLVCEWHRAAAHLN